MTRTHNHTRKKANAVFFSALMLLSMVAIGFAATPAAAAQSIDQYDPENPWQGQVVNATVSGLNSGDEVDLRRVTETSNAGSSVSSSTFIRELNVEDDGQTVLIETEGLDPDDYFLSGSGLSSTPSMDDTFEVRSQSLDAEFEDDVVTDSGGDSETDLDISSNRGTYTLNVSAAGDLDNEELFEILTGLDFDETDPTAVTFTQVEQAIADGNSTLNDSVSGDAQFGDFNVFIYVDGQDDDDLDADEKVGMFQIQDRERTVDFDDIDGGEYEYLFEVIDTSTEATATITVDDVDDAEVSFVDSTVEAAQGGVVTIAVEANDAADSGLLVIGEIDEYGYQLNVTIDEFNDNDEITIYFNTYTAGTSGMAHGATPMQSIVWVDEDDADEDASIDYGATEEHGDSDALEFILSTGDYDMQVLAIGDFDDAVESPDDVGSLIISERATPGMGIWIASSDTAADLDDVTDVVAGIGAGNVTERDLVAQDDFLIHELGDGTGLDGVFQYIERTPGVTLGNLTNSSTTGAPSNLFEAKNSDDGEDERAARLRVRETRASAGPNVDRRQLTDLSDVSLLTTEGESAVFIVVDTGGWNEGTSPFNDGNEPVLDDDDDYEFNTNFRLEDNWLLEFDEDEDGDLVDSFEAADSTYDVEERTGAFISDPYNVTATENVEITADTNVAPGTELDIRARSSGDTRPSFIKTQSDLVVGQDERVTGTFDFSDTNVGDEFELTLRPTGEFPDDVEVDGFVVEALDEESQTPTETPEETPEETPDESPDEETPTPDEETPTETPDNDTSDDTDDDTPGFGALVALVALLAAALLAIRRRL